MNCYDAFWHILNIEIGGMFFVLYEIKCILIGWTCWIFSVGVCDLVQCILQYTTVPRHIRESCFL